MINRLNSTLDFQSQALVLRAERQRLIASNIANADTPGYVARDFDFAQALQAATDSRRGGFRLAESQPAAIDEATSAWRGSHEPRLNYAMAGQTNLDRNTVDMDRERASFVDNSLRYESTLRFINSSVRTMQDAMKSHNQA